MAVDLPELTTVGALFAFSKRLEETAADLLGRLSDAGHAEAARIAKKHTRRADDVERSRKEKMNETILEPLTEIDNSPYIPSKALALASDADADALRDAALDLERRSASFYEDAADKAGPVIGEVKRQFERMAKDNRKFASSLEG